MASHGDDVEEFVISDENCQKLIDQFTSITQTNEAEAQMLLQERNWNLDLALNDFFGGEDAAKNTVSTAGQKHPPSSKASGSESKKSRSDTCSSGSSKTSSGEEVTKANKKELIFITWNIDGLTQGNLELRTKAVCQIIRDTQADVIFLQEIIPATEAIIRGQLSESHHVIEAREWKGYPAEYYTMTLLRKATVNLKSHQVVDYDLSVMTRNMLVVSVEVNGISVHLINTHLESTKEYSSHRFQQIKQIRSVSKKLLPPNEPMIIAGDMNLRDKELEDWGGIPPDWEDAWTATGSRAECRYTWDTLRNDNLKTNFGKYKPRCRFDRIWFRDSKPSRLVPSQFSLIGIQRLKPHVCFPSDHWGILCIFNTFSSLLKSSGSE